jgi:hypothetical protein
MNLDSELDISYHVNPRIASSIRTADSVTIRGAGEPFELSFSLFQLLLVFAEQKTVRQAFDSLDVDVDLSEFRDIIDGFIGRGLLDRDQPSDDAHDPQQLLNPRIFSNPATVDRLRTWLRQGRAVIIPEALPRDRHRAGDIGLGFAIRSLHVSLEPAVQVAPRLCANMLFLPPWCGRGSSPRGRAGALLRVSCGRSGQHRGGDRGGAAPRG